MQPAAAAASAVKAHSTDRFVDCLDLWVRPDEQCVALTRDYRLIQRLRGHRYSVDDMLVAQLACQRSERPRRVLDLGCGIGSVLLTVAWAFPDAELVGVEMQPEHAGLARRNLVLNGCEDRACLAEGDLRDEKLLRSLGTFDLITATPPYFSPTASTVSSDRQRAYAYWELRGGIEEYARAAQLTLADGGLFVTCASATPPERSAAALEDAGLFPCSSRPVVPRVGKPPFLMLLTASTATRGDTIGEEPLVLRDADGARTSEHIAAREWCLR